MQPSEDDIRRWQEVAKRRNAILPYQFQFLSKKDIHVTCGSCKDSFMRPMIAGQHDPVYVCTNCQSRNYVPIEWNVKRRYGKSNY